MHQSMRIERRLNFWQTQGQSCVMQKGEEAVGLPPEKDFSDKMVVLLLYYSAASFSLVPLNHRTCVQAQMIKVERGGVPNTQLAGTLHLTTYIQDTITNHVLKLAQCLKMTQNVSFEFFNYGIFHQFFPNIIDLSGITV